MAKLTIAPWLHIAGLEERTGSRRLGQACRWSPTADLLERKDGFLILMELPGQRLDDVSIELHGSVLTVSGVKSSQPSGEGVVHHVVERCQGPFLRSFTLPGALRRRDVKATLKDGLLTIELPKAKPTPRTIHLD